MLSSGKESDAGHDQKKLLAELYLHSSAIEVYPASLAQQRLWFLDQLETKSAAYNVHLGFWLRGPLDVGALKASLQEVLNRHASLRTSFRLEGSQLVQVITEGLPIDLPITVVEGTGNLYPETYALAQEEVDKPFDLESAPLFRTRLFRVTAEDHVLLCTLHHIVTDSWSMQILAKELAALYTAFATNSPSPLAELPINYGDFAEWQRKSLSTEKIQQELAFWKDELADAPPCLKLQMQRPRPAEQTFSGASQLIAISPETMSALKKLAVRLKATPFMLLLAAFKTLLYRASGQADVLVGVPVAGRNPVETEALIGFFVNTLVLRTDLFGNRPFSDIVAQVRETMFRAFANADVPFENVVEALQPERNLSYNPIFQVMFAQIKAAVQSHSFGDLIAFPYVVSPTTSIFDMTMTIVEGLEGQWWAELDYNSDLFASKDIEALLADYTKLLEAVAASPETHVLDFALTTAIPNLNQQSAAPKRKIAPAAKSHRSELQPVTAGMDREQELLVSIWKKLLKLPDVGIDDNFFDVGGHSLLAAQLTAQVQNATGRKVPLSSVFRAPTIRAYAALLRENAISKPDPLLMRLKDGNSQIAFFAVAAPQVDTFGFAQLAHYLPTDQSVYKLQASDPVVRGRPLTQAEIKDLARASIAAMRSIQPKGPYCLGAMCGGVVIAQEMALQLEAAGDEVGFLAIFDTWVLENSQIRALWAVDYYSQRFRNFRAVPLSEKLATVRRFFGKTNGSSNVELLNGWKSVYWPGEDFIEPQFKAPILLFKRPRQPYFYVKDPQMGWGARSQGGVEICEIDCGHVEMMREPFVHVVGQKLADRLELVARQHGAQSTLDSPDHRSDLDPGTWVNSVA
jgi:thioesterase domain-containing protein